MENGLNHQETASTQMRNMISRAMSKKSETAPSVARENDGGTFDDVEISQKGVFDLERGSSADSFPHSRDEIRDDGDVEDRVELEKSRTAKSTGSARDQNLVTFSGSDDQENPRNWSFKRKWAATIIGLKYLSSLERC